MKRQTQLLSAPALSVGLTFSASFQTTALIPDQIADQVPLPSLAPTLEKVPPAVMSVRVEGTASQGQKIPEEFKKFFGDNLPDQPTQPFEGLGSGAVINASKGYVPTNNHVINQAQKISVQLNDGRELGTKLIGSDDQGDTALLQTQDPSRLTQIATADFDELRVGDSAVAVGNPFGLGQAVISGIVSALGRSGLNSEGLESFIQTDASINRDNSGSVLLNPNGELTGTNTAVLAPGGGSIGVGFAIPDNTARALVQQLIGSGEIKRSLLGIKDTEMSANIVKAFNLDVQHGASVSEVSPGLGSAKVGVKADDITTSPNGEPLNSFAELCPRTTATGPGMKAKPGPLRNGKPLEVEVTPDTGTSSSASAGMITSALEGATLSDGQLKDGGKGIEIDEAVKGNPTAQAGLQRDDAIIGVNHDRANLTAEMRKVLAAKPVIIAL